MGPPQIPRYFHGPTSRKEAEALLAPLREDPGRSGYFLVGQCRRGGPCGAFVSLTSVPLLSLCRPRQVRESQSEVRVWCDGVPWRTAALGAHVCLAVSLGERLCLLAGPPGADPPRAHHLQQARVSAQSHPWPLAGRRVSRATPRGALWRGAVTRRGRPAVLSAGEKGAHLSRSPAASAPQVQPPIPCRLTTPVPPKAPEVGPLWWPLVLSRLFSCQRRERGGVEPCCGRPESHGPGRFSRASDATRAGLTRHAAGRGQGAGEQGPLPVHPCPGRQRCRHASGQRRAAPRGRRRLGAVSAAGGGPPHTTRATRGRVCGPPLVAAKRLCDHAGQVRATRGPRTAAAECRGAHPAQLALPRCSEGTVHHHALRRVAQGAWTLNGEALEGLAGDEVYHAIAAVKGNALSRIHLGKQVTGSAQ